MPSPFPGMDPYLEGYLWPDVHHALAGKIRQRLAPLVRPRYVARLGVYVVEDTAPESEIGIMYPDVEVALGRPATQISETQAAYMTTTAPLVLPHVWPVEVQITTVEIRDAAHNRLVTAIEVLSPVNKREPGLTAYRHKRHRLYQAGVHLVELDLLRRGTRPLAHPRLPDVEYVIALTRAHAAGVEVWPVGLREGLPTIPIPLLPPDEDVPLDLGAALREVYDEAGYDLSIDYAQPPPPPALSADDEVWVRERVRAQAK